MSSNDSLPRVAQPGAQEIAQAIEHGYKRAYERLELCPDHRDKATGRCIVCVAEERTRRELKAEPAGQETAPLPSKREELIAARNGLMAAIVKLRGGHAAVMDDCDEAMATLDIAIGKAFMAQETAPLPSVEKKA